MTDWRGEICQHRHLNASHTGCQRRRGGPAAGRRAGPVSSYPRPRCAESNIPKSESRGSDLLPPVSVTLPCSVGQQGRPEGRAALHGAGVGRCPRKADQQVPTLPIAGWGWGWCVLDPPQCHQALFTGETYLPEAVGGARVVH